ncbi:MFS transporter [Legionella dresdenensis]|uniref:Lysosomal dipeptide transporter MFSD1 n=1 Tax=Legionella dresdenensis TaxID=450200 RepID=A0ABV8CHJ4_9GAMM
MTSLSKKNPGLAYASFVVGLCALFLFYKYVLQIFPSIITDELMQTFKLTGTGLGNLAATFYYAYMITQLFVGILMDKFSSRLLTSLAIGCCALGALIFSQMYSEFYAGVARALMGMGVAFATVSYLKLAAMWFPARYYSFVSGLLATAVMLGAVFGQTPLSLLTDWLGWRDCLLLVGVFGLALAFIFALAVRDSQPESAVQTPLNFSDIMTVLKNKQNWLLTLYSGFAFSPLAVFGGLWGNPFLQQAYLIDKTQASSLMSLVFIGLGIGSPLSGLLAQRLNARRKVMFAGLLLSLITITMVIYYPSSSLLVAGSQLFLFGLGTGAFMLVFTIGKETNKLCLTATVIAMINTSDAFLDALTEPLIGRLLDLSGAQMVDGVTRFTLTGFHTALAILPLYLLLGLVFLGLVQERAS